MTAVSLSTARDTLSELMDQVTREHRPVIIREGGRKAVVMMALEDYEEQDETAYLMSDPVRRQRLLQAMEQSKAGKTVEHAIDLGS